MKEVQDTPILSSGPHVSCHRRIGKDILRKPKLRTPTLKTDILISIKPIYMEQIVARSKDHEFRTYLIPGIVQRMWFYVSAPQQTLQYIAVVSHGKTPGEIDGDSNGLGNIEFNTRRGGKSYAYEIKELYQLHESLPLAEMREKYRVTFPQRYSYVTESMAKDIVYHDQIRLF